MGTERFQGGVKAGFERVYRGAVEWDGLLLSHEPILSERRLNIHGHLHTQPYPFAADLERYWCVSVERVNYRPVTLREIKELVSNEYWRGGPAKEG